MLDTAEQVNKDGVRRNGVKVEFSDLQLQVHSMSQSRPISIPMQLAVSREGFFNFTQVNF